MSFLHLMETFGESLDGRLARLVRALCERKHETKDVLVTNVSGGIERALLDKVPRGRRSPVALAIRALVKVHEHDNYVKES